MTPAPSSFATQVSAFFNIDLKANQEQSHAIWARVFAAEPGLAKRFAADSHSNLQQLVGLVARLNPTLALRNGSEADQWRTVARNKKGGKGDGKGKGPAIAFAQPNARAKPAKGAGKGGSK